MVELQILPVDMHELKKTLGHGDYKKYRFTIEAMRRTRLHRCTAETVPIASDNIRPSFMIPPPPPRNDSGFDRQESSAVVISSRALAGDLVCHPFREDVPKTVFASSFEGIGDGVAVIEPKEDIAQAPRLAEMVDLPGPAPMTGDATGYPEVQRKASTTSSTGGGSHKIRDYFDDENRQMVTTT